jgi:uncharacterized protein involved in exopolysaccharide biosynthesis
MTREELETINALRLQRDQKAARIAELERVYADEYPTAPREQRKRWAVEGAQYEADERDAIKNEGSE